MANPSIWASFAIDRSHLNSIYNPVCRAAAGIQVVVGNFDVVPTSLRGKRGEVGSNRGRRRVPSGSESPSGG